MPSIRVKDFNLQATVESGQLFRYERRGDGYIILHRDDVFFVRQDGDALHYRGIGESAFSHFFRLDEDHCAVLDEINKDVFVNESIRSFRGLRLMRQDPWECLVGFVCSSASNIPKIRMNLRNISASFGRPISFGDDVYFSFPRPGELSDLERLRGVKAGFRADYLHKINRMVTDDSLAALRDMPYEAAKSALTSLPGIGDKVASCILLFSLGFDEAFPVDTWVTKIVQDLYFGGKRVPMGVMQGFGKDHFGAKAGYAQQYLFHWIRNRDASIAIGASSPSIVRG